MVPSCVRFASYYMKNIYGLERHKYAPELNKLWYTDDTYDRVPGCVSIDEAEKYAKLLGYNYQSSQWYENTYSLFDKKYQIRERQSKEDREKKKKGFLKRFKSLFN